MEQQAPYRNKFFGGLIIMLCVACGKKHAAPAFLNADSVQISTSAGITTINAVPFSGKLFQLYPNGDTMFVRNYSAGKEHGEWKEFYPLHKLKEERYFENGNKQGRYLAYWENGAKMLEYNFKDGEYEGTCSDWLSNGHLIKQMHYKKGHEEGSQRAWYDDGRVRSNYTVLNGRRFGLLGTKNCRNVSDSIFTGR